MKVPTHVIAAIMAAEWAIEPTFLDTIIKVASREEPFSGPITTTKMERPNSTLVIEDGIAIINLVGPIIRYGDFFQEVCSGATSLDTMTKCYQEAMENPKVQGILFNIDSPGGQANGIAEFSDMIRAGCKKKKTMAYTGGSMASAAYWIGSACEHITAAETAFVGSIGVVVSINKSDDNSITVTNSKSPKKRVDPSTEEGIAYITRNIDALAEVFYNKVSEFRSTAVDKVVSDFGQGGVLIATSAVTVGMVDAVGSFDTAMKQLKEQVMSKPETVEELQAASPELVQQITAAAEAKVREEMKAQMEAQASQTAEAKAQAETMRKQILEGKLSTMVGSEIGAKLMGFDGALAEDQLTDLAGIIQTKNAAIKELTDKFGAPSGVPATVNDVIDSDAADKAGIEKIMKEEGLDETQAMIAHEERKLQRKA